jgi:hypothetical protein
VVAGGEWRLAVQTTATAVGCRAEGREPSSTAAVRSGCATCLVGGRPVVLAWRKRIWRCREPACGVHTWTEGRRDGWLQARPRDWLAQVGMAALDPWRGYASALVAPLGHATVVVDHVHAIRHPRAAGDRGRAAHRPGTGAAAGPRL